MISGAFTYDAVNIVLAVTGLLSLFLVVRLLPDKNAKLLLVIALIMVILSGVILLVAMRMYKYSIIVFAAEELGKVEAGTVARWENLCDIFLVGNVFELVVVALFVSISKRLASLRNGAAMGEEQRNEL